MHEALLKRGDVDYVSIDIAINIYVGMNCVLVHPACHEEIQQGERGLYLSLNQILTYYSRRTVLEWLEWMAGNMYTTRAKELIRIVEEIQLAEPLELLQPERTWTGALPRS